MMALGDSPPAPDRDVVHIWQATADSGGNTVTAHSSNTLVLENSGHASIGMLTGTSSHGGIYVGSSDGEHRGRIIYAHGDEQWIISSVATTRLTIDDTSIHVMASGIPDVELEVSDGSTTGGGTIHRAASAAHSLRELKSDIVYLTDTDCAEACDDVKLLKHATFRYLRNVHPVVDGAEDRSQVTSRIRDASLPLHTGIVYEDAPTSIRGPEGTVVIDKRIAVLEMALKHVIGRMELGGL